MNVERYICRVRVHIKVGYKGVFITWTYLCDVNQSPVTVTLSISNTNASNIPNLPKMLILESVVLFHLF